MLMDCMIGFVIAFVISFAATPLVRRVAIKIGAIDVPLDNRRMHTKPTPLMGGLAIFFGIIIALIFGICVSYFEYDELVFDNRIIGYIIGATIILLMGIVDDLKSIKARYKLIIQIIAAGIVVYFGVSIGSIANPFMNGEYFNLGWLEIPLTILWIVGITNAINFIDGLDGLATGITCISSLSLLFVFILTGQSIAAIFLAIILAGATLGFLPYNFNPAKIFMGDTGSNFLGFTLAILSILGLAKTYTFIAVLAPIVILALPIFDTGFAVIRRLINKRPLMEADKGHIHHKLIGKGLTTKQVVFILYIVCILLGMLAIVLVEASLWKVIVLVIIIMVFVYAGIKHINESEDVGLLGANTSQDNQDNREDKDVN